MATDKLRELFDHLGSVVKSLEDAVKLHGGIIWTAGTGDDEDFEQPVREELRKALHEVVVWRKSLGITKVTVASVQSIPHLPDELRYDIANALIFCENLCIAFGVSQRPKSRKKTRFEVATPLFSLGQLRTVVGGKAGYPDSPPNRVDHILLGDLARGKTNRHVGGAFETMCDTQQQSIARHGNTKDFSNDQQAWRFVSRLCRQKQGEFVHYKELIDAVWGDSPPTGDKDALRKIKDRVATEIAELSLAVETVRQQGYRLVEALQETVTKHTGHSSGKARRREARRSR